MVNLLIYGAISLFSIALFLNFFFTMPKALKLIYRKKLRDKQLLDRLNLLENVISVIPANIYWTDKKGICLGCNNNQAKFIGLTSKRDIIGKAGIDAANHSTHQTPSHINQLTIKKGIPVVMEEMITFHNGEKGIFLSNKIPLYNRRKEIIGLVVVSNDITHHKKIEKDLDSAKKAVNTANVLKNQFLQNMEHDLRTPTAGIVAVTEYLTEQEKDPDKNACCHLIDISAKELLKIINEILNFRSLEYYHSISEKFFNLKTLLKEVFQLNLAASAAKGLVYNYEVHPDVPINLLGDPFRLKHILINLIGNAIKFTEKGKVIFYVRLLEKHNIQKTYLQFFIEDSGIGIPNDKQALIYEKFVRLTPSNQGIHKGLGLGLYVVKNYVNNLNGHISIASEKSKGTTFIVTIPFKQSLVKLDRIGEKNFQGRLNSSSCHNKTNELDIDVFEPVKIDEITGSGIIDPKKSIYPIMKAALLEEKPKLVDTFRMKNWNDLKFLLHKLKGSASYSAALSLEKACGKMEDYLKSEQNPIAAEVSPMYQRILTEIDRLEKASEAKMVA